MTIPDNNHSDIAYEEMDNLTIGHIIHSAAAAMAIIKSDGQIIDRNPEFENLLPGAKPGINIVEFIPNKHYAIQLKNRLNANEEVISAVFTNIRQKNVKARLNLLPATSESFLYLITAKFEENYGNDPLIQQLINSVPDIIFIKNVEGKFMHANNRVTEILGAKVPADVIGKTEYEFEIDEHTNNYFKDDINVIKNGFPVLNTQDSLLIEGEHKYYSTSKVPLIGQDGQIIGLLSVGRDITLHIDEKKSLEKAWLEADKADKLKSAFLANLSHEIRTPLNGILGFSQFLKQKSHSLEKQHKYLDIIHNNGKQLLMLLNDIIDISMIESNQVAINKQMFRMNSLLAHLHTNFEHQVNSKSVNLKLISKPGLPDNDDLLFSDDYRLHQVLGNLIGNAVKFTSSGTIEYGYTLEDGILTFFVEDSGIGISNNQLTEIFQRFRQADESITRKYGGTGLGLSICKGLVEMLGGEIFVKSQKGKGSRFYFTIPYTTTRS